MSTQKNKLPILGVVAILVMVILVGSAYAYSAFVTANGDINGSYITVDVLKEDSSGSSAAITTNLRTIITDGAYEYKDDDADKYFVHVESNKYNQAWLYGSFSTDALIGCLVESISITLRNGENDETWTLERSAEHDLFSKNPITLSSTLGKHSNDLQIIKINVVYNTSQDTKESFKATDKDGTTHEVTLTDAKSLEELTFNFLASSKNTLA